MNYFPGITLTEIPIYTQIQFKEIINNREPQDPTAIYHLSRKPSKKSEKNMLVIAEESKYDFISDVLQWTPTYAHTSAGRL